MQFIDDNYAYLGCCRQDKKCNFSILPMYNHFYVTRAEWSGWRMFSTYSKGLSARKNPGQTVESVTIKYIDKSGVSRQFTFSPFFPDGSIEKLKSYKDYEPRNAGLSLRAGQYTAIVKVIINEDLNNFFGEYEERISFYVSESGNVVLTLLATLGAKYSSREKLGVDFKTTRTVREIVESKLEHKAIVLDGEQARGYYKWWDLDTNLIKVEPTGTPWGFAAPAPVRKPAAKPTATAPKTTATKTTATKPTASYTPPRPAPVRQTPPAPARPAAPTKPIKPAVPMQNIQTTTKKLEMKPMEHKRLEIKR